MPTLQSRLIRVDPQRCMTLRLVYSYLLKDNCSKSNECGLTGNPDNSESLSFSVPALIGSTTACYIYVLARDSKTEGRADFTDKLLCQCWCRFAKFLRRAVFASCEYRVGASGMWVLERRSRLCLPGTNNDMPGVRGNQHGYLQHAIRKRGSWQRFRQGSMGFNLGRSYYHDDMFQSRDPVLFSGPTCLSMGLSL